MLFISRKELENVKAALREADLRTADGMSPMLLLPDEVIEAAALHGLSLMSTMSCGWADSVHPSDVQYFKGVVPLFEPPKLD